MNSDWISLYVVFVKEAEQYQPASERAADSDNLWKWFLNVKIAYFINGLKNSLNN